MIVVAGRPAIRVLVVDDSAFARKVVRDVLARADGIDVVGVARDGLEALEKVAELQPDVVTLDLMMPGLDGIGVLRSLGALLPRTPRIVIVSSSDTDSELAVQALQAGAVGLVHKPTALAVERLYDMGLDLIGKVREAYVARPLPEGGAMPTTPPPPLAQEAPHAASVLARARLIVVGTSTGGPQALTRFLRMLPESLPVPVLVALHIPPGYTASLAQRLDSVSAVHVDEARDGLLLTPGLVAIAPGGSHLEIGSGDNGAIVARLDASVHGNEAHAPSVNVLFESAARTLGAGVVGVVLTGMGDDGLAGAAAIKAAGGRVVAESAASCVVYGMPRCVIEAGYADDVASIDGIAAAVMRWV